MGSPYAAAVTEAADAAFWAGQYLERAWQREDITDTGDLDKAVAFAREGLAAVHGDADLELDLRALLGGALVCRGHARIVDRAQGQVPGPGAGDTASLGAVRADLDEGIGYLEALLAVTPAADPDRVPLLVQLTFAYQGLAAHADEEDLPARIDQTVEYAQEAWPLLGLDDPDRPTVGLCLASGLYEQVHRRRAEYPAGLMDATIDVLSHTVPLLDEGSGERLLSEAMLGAALAIRGQERGNQADFSAARPLALKAAAALPKGDPAHAQTARELASRCPSWRTAACSTIISTSRSTRCDPRSPPPLATRSKTR